MYAEIVTSPFHAGRGEPHTQGSLKEREILGVDLFLEILRARGDNDSAATAESRSHCGHQVSERFASAGSRFHDQMSALFERTHYCPRHLNLAGTMLVFGMSVGD
jgi:hypothetical protein